jgi:PAS domain S-box-containing protein
MKNAKNISAERFNDGRGVTHEIESKERLDLAWSATEDGLWDWQVDRNEIYYSDKWKSMIGYLPDEFPNDIDAFLTAIHPDDLAHFQAELNTYLQSPSTKNFKIEFRLRCKDNTYKWIRGRGKAMLNPDGTPHRMLGAHTDITEQKQLVDQLAASETRWRAAVDGSGDGLWDWNILTSEVYFSDRWKRMLGFEPDEIQASLDEWIKRVHPDDLEQVYTDVQKCMRQETPIYRNKHRVLCKDGRYKWILDRGVIIEWTDQNAPKRMIGTHTDIDDSENTFQINQAIMQHASDGIFIMRFDGSLYQCNPRAAALLGYEMPEMLTLNVFDWDAKISPEDMPKIFATLSDTPIAFETQHRRKDGSIYEASITAVRFQLQGEAFIYAAVRDISEQKVLANQIQEINTRLGNIADTVPGMIFSFQMFPDGHSCFPYASKHIDSIYGVRPEDVREDAASVFSALCADDLEQVKTSIRLSFAQLSEWQDEYRVNHPDKGIIWVKGSSTPIKQADGSVIWYGYIRETTQEKQDELALREAKETAEQAARAKSAFLANMSHEIRTPLNGVIGLNTLLLNTQLNDQQQDYVQKSLQSSKALLGVINDILDYSKIEAGKLELSAHQFSLEKLLHETTDLFEYSIISKGLDIHIDFDAHIPNILIGDTLRITQVLNNLIGNAVKFTEKGDITITVTLAHEIDQDIAIKFSIRDTGIGMTAEEQHKLFQAFTQTDASNTRRYGGTGLGLVITQQLVDMMGGKLEVNSVKDQGSTFYFTLHFAYSEESKPLIIPADRFKDRTFMIIEDNDVERALIGTILTSWGVEPILCATGEEALAIAKHTPIDYALVDWRLPGLDGLDVIEALRANHAGTFPKVVMISALMRDELIQKARSRQLHPDAILHKPVTPSVLLEALLDRATIHTELHTHTSATHLSFVGRVLVAEDNEVNQLVIRDLLEGLGLSVAIAHNGSEAVQMSQQNPYDLILMDIQMPILDGFGAAKAIRTFNSQIPIIALSAAVMQQDKILAHNAGMNGHLAKPIDMESLMSTLSTYLKAIETQSEPISQTTALPTIDIDGIHTDQLVHLLGSHEKVIHLLQTFANTQRNFCTNIESHDSGSDAFKRMIHALKGVSGNLAAVNLHQLCVNIEQSAPEMRSRLLTRLCTELTQLIEAIDKISPLIPIVIDSTVSRSEVKKSIDDMLAKLNMNAFIPSQEREAFIRAIHPVAQHETLKQIDIALMTFDFSTAITLTHAIRETIHD